MRKLTVLLILTVGCSNSDNKKKSCDPTMPTMGCSNDQVCENVTGGQPTCEPALVVRGHVTDPSAAPIPNALVSALDANGAPASGSTTTDAMGAYELRIPADRSSAGAPSQKSIALRAAAAGYETFPSGLRRSLPIELSTATLMDGKYVVMSALTEIELVPVANASGLGSIAGTVKNGAGKSGALLVAEGGGTVATGVSDTDGAYEIFNLPAGSYTVSAYEAGVQYTPAMGSVTAGMRTTGVDLEPNSMPLNTVSGSVNIVNPMGGTATSVVLVVESTFNDALKRGEVPPGLRAPSSGAPSITNSFMIEGVPDGKYVVLAAFENDGLVRDPDTSIAGTQIDHIMLPGTAMPLAQFKITGALAVISPGANDVPDEVTGTPTFKWQDDSSEDKYTLDVFDQHGAEIWGPIDLPSVSGGGSVMAAYGGPALAAGEYYQFRATSWKRGVAISQTEDLKGVFIAK